jgi:ABC-2 type transport system permease protein
LHNVLLIAKREYLEKIRGRAFRFSTVLVPLGIFVLLGVSIFTSRNAATGKHLAIAADNAALANQVRREMLYDAQAKLTVDVVAPVAPEDRAVLEKQLRSKAIDGILNIDTSSTGEITATYTSLSPGGFANIGALQNYLNRGVVHERLIASGMNPAELGAVLKWVSIDTLRSNKEGNAGKGKSSGMAAFSKYTTMAFLIAMPILLYGMDTARSIIEEKTSRIFEVMLAVASPEEMLTGKLIGVGAVGLTQVAIWVAAAALLTGTALATPLLSGDLALHFSWAEGILFPVYFLLGFFLYSALFSGLAATCETAQELQMYTPLAVIPVWLSFGILPLILNNPSSPWAVAASLFPPTAPFVMLPRMGLETPPLWQFAVSIGLLILSILGILWFSSRLYRVGILMYGKRATLPELLRWLRYS